MAEITIKSETQANRCDVCHLADQFDPEKNYCNRCANIKLPEILETNNLNPKYRMVGGWLFFFCIVTLFLNPLSTITMLLLDYANYSIYFRDYLTILAWFIITNVLSIGVASLGVYVSISLLRIRAGAINSVKLYLRLFVLVSFILSITTILAFKEFTEVDQMEDWINRIFAEFLIVTLYCAAWYYYFCKSKRVLATYNNYTTKISDTN